MNYKEQFLLLLFESVNSKSINPLVIPLPQEGIVNYGSVKYTPTSLIDIPTLRLSFISNFFNGKMPHDSQLLDTDKFTPYKFLFKNFKKIKIHYFNFVGQNGMLCYFKFQNGLQEFLFEIFSFDNNSVTTDDFSALLNIHSTSNANNKKTEIRTRINCFSSSFKETFTHSKNINSILNLQSDDFKIDVEQKNSIFILSSQGFGSFKKIKYEIEQIGDECLDYYQDEISENAEGIIDLINTRKKGMFLFHGEKGCGKTSFIKYIINNSDKDFYYVNGESAGGFSSGTFLEFIAANSKNAVFIFEDMEHLITSRETKTNSVIADILNASDGILSDILSPIFIFTFNTKVENIDPAFLRPGRLILEQEFCKLSNDKAKKIAKKLKVKLPENKEYALAEIFELQNNSDILKTRSKKFSIEKSHSIKGFANAE
jgi:hypothetical protein